MNQSPEHRRALFNRIREKYLAYGFGFEEDPLFLEWVERWIDGAMPSAELRSRYIRLLGEQERERGRLRQGRYERE